MALVADLNSNLAIVGGVSGAVLLFYFGLMTYYARRKDRHVQEIQVQLARIEGLILGRRGR